ncbi:MAG: hypothetical protein KJ726_07260, partial [Verrucomicrobia bacterium]|nr:hypothetical protein [Verrucomicrobiota bacterium]
AFMALATLPFFFVPALFRDFRVSLRLAVTWGLSCLLGLGLAGYYLYPALTTQHLILAEEWYEPVFRDWRNSFILPLFTAGRYGMRWFGVQWGLGGLAVLSLAVLAIGAWRSRVAPAEDRTLRVGITATVAAACFMASEWSFPLWTMVPLLHSVQWPYRFLLVAMPLGLVGLAWQADVAPSGTGRRTGTAFLAAAALLLSVAGSVAWQVKSLKVAVKPDFAAMRVHDYIRIPVPGSAWKTYLRQGGFAAECAAKGAAFRETVARTHERAWQIATDEATELRLPLYHFPAWCVTVDGSPMETRADGETSLLTVRLPPGRHEVRVRWARLPQEKIGLVISAVCVGILFSARKGRR